MATVNTLTVSPNPVPSGQTGAVTVTFTTNPGTPDLTANIEVFDNNGVAVSQPTQVVIKGVPAEATPTVTVGNTGQGWEIRTDNGKLVAGTSPNTFVLSYS